MNNKYLVLYSWLLVFSAGKCAIAQAQMKETKTFKGSFLLEGNISMDSLTKYIHKNSGISFSFNSTRVKGATEIKFPTGRYTFPAVLQQIRRTTSLYYSIYSGYIIFQDNPPKLKKKESQQKTNIDNKINTLAKINGRSESKILHRNNESITKRDTIVSVTLKKDAIKMIPINFSATERKYSDQKTIDREESQNKKQAIENKGFDDSAIAVTTEKDEATKRLSREVRMNESTEIVVEYINKEIDSANQTKSTILINKGSEKKIKNRSYINYGVLWNINIPTYGLKEYLTATNGKSQPYNFLLPGLWVSKTIGKKSNEIVLLLKAGQQYFTGNKVVATFTGPFSSVSSVSIWDTTKIYRKTVLIKTNGIEAGLLYRYHLNGKWNIGGGLNINWEYAALINQQTAPLLNAELLTDWIHGIKKSSQEWKYLNSSFFTARIEATYNVKKIDIGCAVNMAITDIFTAPINNSPQPNGLIFFRWKIH